MALSRQQLDAGKYAEALAAAVRASDKPPTLRDYAQFYRAQAAYRLKDYRQVSRAVTEVFSFEPLSPLTGQAAALAVTALLDGDDPKQAFEIVKKYSDRIPQPQSTLLLARCFQANGDLAQAAEYYQRVYYGYPTAREAVDAANALVDLKNRLGESYPPIMPAAMLGRAGKLLDARRPADARTELLAAIPQLAGVQADIARVRLGVADYRAGKVSEALDYLKNLQVDQSEADAERQDYMVRCARKLNRNADVKEYLDELELHHPQSEWRLDALIHVADQERIDNDIASYVPLYRACRVSFPKDPRTAWCAWQIAFNAYRTDSADAYDELAGYLKQYGDSQDTANALYFLGRLKERKNDFPAARACYDELIAHLPNTYYATVAQARLKTPELQSAKPSVDTLAILKTIPWAPRPQFPSFTPGPLVKKRVARSSLLAQSGMNDLAEDELKFGARNEDGQGNVYAYELAKMAANRAAPDEALRFVKAFAPGYLFMPLDQAPVDFWKLAFPLPFRSSIEINSKEEGLDPFLVAALIRQESEFNPGAVSPMKAVGLMQVMPRTGAQLARHFGVRHFNPSQLTSAEHNVQLGAYYFRTLVDSNGGQVEMALAAYNAGPGRIAVWRNWGPFREPSEFIETVPFHETRTYIQVVLRNSDIYRRLYSGTRPDVPAYQPKPAPKKEIVHKQPKTRARLHRPKRRR